MSSEVCGLTAGVHKRGGAGSHGAGSAAGHRVHGGVDIIAGDFQTLGAKVLKPDETDEMALSALGPAKYINVFLRNFELKCKIRKNENYRGTLGF